MSLRRHLWIWSTLGAGLLAAAAWWAGGDTSWRRVAAAGVLRVGYAVEAPYAFLIADGVPTGEGPESARQIAQRLGLARVDFVQVPFAELIPGLLERRYDLIAAGLFVTAERATRVRFSAPTEVWPDTLAAARHVDGVAFAFHPQDAALQRAWARVQRDWVAGAQHVALVGRYGFTDDEVQARHQDGATR